VVRIYLPPDANCLLSVTDHCLKSRNLVNLVVCGKQPAPQWLTMDQAIKHCTAGIGIWEWASNDQGGEPDVVMACCGDVPTLETLAAVDLIRGRIPELKVRVINVVDLMTLEPPGEHPHALSDKDFDLLFSRSSSHSTATRGSSTGSRTAATTTTTCTSAATRKRAPPRRRSTWSCSTTWIASTWSAT
jgi:xylulose-5-phosphate/fructose-6-phosphate phosphoketolase